MSVAPSRVDVLTFGCRLNGVEADAMAGLAHAAGHDDLTIVNTCAVTAEAVRQARQAIRRAARDNPGRPVVVTGCAAAIDPAGFAAMPEVPTATPNTAKPRPAPGRPFRLGSASPAPAA